MNFLVDHYLERDILENDDGVLGRVLFKQSLEVGGAGRQDHLVSLAGLSIASLERKYINRKTRLQMATKYYTTIKQSDHVNWTNSIWNSD